MLSVYNTVIVTWQLVNSKLGVGVKFAEMPWLSSWLSRLCCTSPISAGWHWSLVVVDHVYLLHWQHSDLINSDFMCFIKQLWKYVYFFSFVKAIIDPSHNMLPVVSSLLMENPSFSKIAKPSFVASSFGLSFSKNVGVKWLPYFSKSWNLTKNDFVHLMP